MVSAPQVRPRLPKKPRSGNRSAGTETSSGQSTNNPIGYLRVAVTPPLRRLARLVADGWGRADVVGLVDLGGSEGGDVGAGDGEAQLVGAKEALPQLPLGGSVLGGEEADDRPVEP